MMKKRKKIPKYEDGTQCPCALDANGNCPCDPNIPIIEGAKARTSNILGFAGNALFGSAMTGEPNPGMGALGGAITGLTTGGGIGAVLGALTGFANAGQAREDYERMLDDQKDRYMRDRTFLPDMLAEGGMTGDAIQTEDGETLVLPTLAISKVKAKEKHKDMEDSEVTDIVPQGTIVFSAKKTLDLKKHADHKLAEALAFYDDHDKYDFKGLKVGDILGDDGEISYAEAINRVKKFYPTTKEKNLIAEQTNEMNMAARKPILEYLFRLQSGANTDMNSDPVPKAVDGYPDYQKLLKQLLEEGNITDPQALRGPEIPPGSNGLLDIRVGDPSVNSSFNPFGFAIDPNQVSPLTLDPTAPIDPLNARTPINVDQLPRLSLPGQINSTTPAVDPLNGITPYGASRAINTNPTSPQEDSFEDLLNKYRAKYGKQRGELDTRFANDKNEINTLIRKKNANNAYQLANQALFTGLQSGYKDLALESTSLIEDQFRDIPAALIDQQVSGIAANSNSLVKALSDAGVGPGEIANYAGKSTAAISDAQGDLRAKQNMASLQNNKQRIAEFRNVIQGNKEKLADSEGHLTDFNNKKIAGIGSFLNSYLDNKDSILDTNYRLTNQNEADYYAAAGAIDKGLGQVDAAELTLKGIGPGGQMNNQSIINYINSLSPEEKKKLLQTLG